MRMGTRWTAGTVPPASVPDVLRAQIAAVEESTPPDALGQASSQWTLTWLEGRPIAESDTGVIVSLDHDGEVVVRHDADDEFA